VEIIIVICRELTQRQRGTLITAALTTVNTRQLITCIAAVRITSYRQNTAATTYRQ